MAVAMELECADERGSKNHRAPQRAPALRLNRRATVLPTVGIRHRPI